jgi:hypothetical protein
MGRAVANSRFCPVIDDHSLGQRFRFNRINPMTHRFIAV